MGGGELQGLLGPLQPLFKFTSFHYVNQWCLCVSSRQALYPIFTFTGSKRWGGEVRVLLCSQTKKHLSWFICSRRRSTTKTFKSAPWKFFNETLSSWGQEWYQFPYLQHCAWHVVKGCVWRQGAGRDRDRDRDWESLTKEQVPRGLPLAKLKSQAAFSPLEVLWAWKINLMWA